MNLIGQSSDPDKHSYIIDTDCKKNHGQNNRSYPEREVWLISQFVTTFMT